MIHNLTDVLALVWSIPPFLQQDLMGTLLTFTGWFRLIPEEPSLCFPILLHKAR